LRHSLLQSMMIALGCDWYEIFGVLLKSGIHHLLPLLLDRCLSLRLEENQQSWSLLDLLKSGDVLIVSWSYWNLQHQNTQFLLHHELTPRYLIPLLLLHHSILNIWDWSFEQMNFHLLKRDSSRHRFGS